MSVARRTAAEIQEALSIAKTADSAAAVKRAVARSLTAVDPGLTVETTDYFNHSFAPDMVLKWERPAARDERFVFLRFNDDPEWITEELPRLAKRHPLVYGLTETVESDHTETLA